MNTDVSFGVLLPHFGSPQAVDGVLDTARRAEALGFDSLWVRDHLYIPPENRDHGGITEDLFLEGLLSLAAVSAVTDEMTLGTAVANAHRHPLKLSQSVGTLDRLAPDRVVCGVGAGTFRGEFEAVGLPFDRRGRIADETLEILNRTFREEHVSYEGDVFSFEDVTIDPRPGRRTPVWYGGLARIAVKRAFRHADGWFPGRLPLPVLDERLSLLEGLEAEYDRSLDRAYLTTYSVDEDAATALDRIDMERLVADVGRLLNEEYHTPEDIEGAYVAGDPDDCIAQIRRLVDRGFTHVVLDMRHAFDDLDDLLELTADAVVPAFR